MSWFNSKSDIRDKIMDIEKDLRNLEYEYCVKLVSDETKECFIWFFHNLSESMEHFKWLSSITVVKTERIVENAEGYAYLVLFRVITLEEAREMIENEKMAAATEIKNQIADFSIKVAEKVLQKDLASDKEQLDYINRLLDDIENKTR